MTDFGDRIAVIDYGMGNLHSVAKALEHVAPGAQVTVTTDPAALRQADRVVFPGVGAIGDCMAAIRAAGFDRVLPGIVAEKPVLAICVGMQALMEHSEESGGVECLGLLPGRVRFFGDPLVDVDGERLKVPHMGWNVVHQTIDHPLWQGIAQDARFYFVHSYWVDTTPALTAGSCAYGIRFAAALQTGNLFAVQFHPEKSHTDGLRLLANFFHLEGRQPMLVIPAIDLKDGQCVRLRQGRMDEATVFSDDPGAMAAHWVAQGARRLHLVDLNGAFAGVPVNGDAVRAIARAHPQLPVQIGGGIRSAETIEIYLQAGVRYVIIGTKAVTEPDFVARMCREFPDRVIVGIDARGGRVATDGWAEVTEVMAVDLARRFAADGVSAIVYTDIERDGMMGGVNIPATLAVAEAGIPVIASGGVTSLDDIRALKAVAGRGILGAITGRAIYEGTLDLVAAQAVCDAG